MRKFGFVSEGQYSRDSGEAWDFKALPRRATGGSAGYDFYAPHNFIVPQGETKILWSGVRCILEPGDVLLLLPRSSMGKHGIRFTNTVGVIDSDYQFAKNEGHIGIMFENTGANDWAVRAGDKVAQGIIMPHLVVDDDDVSDMRTGGFGSTGK